MRTEEQRQQRKIEIMTKCFECFCEHGLAETSMRQLAKAAGVTPSNLYTYFDSFDELVVQCTGYCMAKVEDEFMALAPKDLPDVARFLREVPYWTARNHGKKYRFMYQVYASPKYHEEGKKFFLGVEQRYTDYAKQLEPVIGIPWQILQPLIFSFVRASVHYAMFEEEGYMKSQIRLIGQACLMMYQQYGDGSFDVESFKRNLSASEE